MTERHVVSYEDLLAKAAALLHLAASDLASHGMSTDQVVALASMSDAHVRLAAELGRGNRIGYNYTEYTP